MIHANNINGPTTDEDGPMSMFRYPSQCGIQWTSEEYLDTVLDLLEDGNSNSNTGRLDRTAVPGRVTAFLLVQDGASGAPEEVLVRASRLSKIWLQYKTLASQPLTKSLLTFFSSSSAHRDPVRDPSCKRTNTSSLPSSRPPSDTSTVSETRIISKKQSHNRQDG